MRAYLRALAAYGRGRLIQALGLALSLTALEGAGLVMLAPLLAVAGVLEAGDAPAGTAERVAALFELSGVPLTLPLVLMLFVALVGAREALSRAQVRVFEDLSSGFVQSLRERLYLAVTGARWTFLTRRRLSDVVHVLATDLTRIGSGTHQLIRLVSLGLMLATYTALALWISPAMTTLLTGVAGVVLWLLRRKIQDARARGRLTTQLGQRLQSTVTEHLGGMKVSKSFGAERRNAEHFSETIRELRAVALAYQLGQADTRLWFALATVAVFGIVVYLAVAVFQVPGPELLVLLFIYTRMTSRVAPVIQGYQQVAHMIPAYESYREWLTRCEAEAESPGGVEVSAPFRLVEKIALDRVSFRYDTDRDPVLHDVNLRIAANRTTAIVGPSGAGKSTLADLLLGLLRPDAGTIQVDGRVLGPAETRAWRSTIGYVPQDTFLFHDTVRANLRWVRPAASDADLWRALDMAVAVDFVRRLPHGLDTEVGERGVQLSGGERQRLALARALLVAPRLLILDEATSHLDSENERRIQEAIERLHGRLTVVVIAHRLSTIRHADQIVVLDAGRVVETGTWDALHRRTDGRLQRLVHAGER